ncbi:hypothetical protein DUGA6_30140 [Duganella sp. HH105]|nr:hypothetical protein DUGA6_30140 [Duganella sp. HH105]
MVDTAQVLDAAVFQIAGQVARLVHAAARDAERIGDEFVRRQVATVDVTACQAIAGDMQLARNAHRHRIEARIQQIHLDVANRPAKHRYIAGVRDGADGRVHGRLGRTVDVEAALGRRLFQLFPQLLRNGFAADQQAGRQCLHAAGLQQHAKLGRGTVERVQTQLSDCLRQQLTVAAHLIRDRAQCDTSCQQQPLLDRGVERQRCVLAHPQAGQVAELRVHGAGQAIDQILRRGMRDGHALRLAGRARGVDHVGQVARRGDAGRIGGVAAIQRRRVGVEQEYRHFAGRQ